MTTPARPSFDDWALLLAASVSVRGDCTRQRVGAVVLDTRNRVVITGYNGAPPGGPSCLAGQCPRGHHYLAPRLDASSAAMCACGVRWLCPEAVEPGSSYDSGPGLCVALHAEQNCLLWADPARLGGATIYVTGKTPGSPAVQGREEWRAPRGVSCLPPSALKRRLNNMLVTEMLKLAPSPEQADALLATMRACNAAATRAAGVAFEHRTANKIRLQPLVYQDLRVEFGLSSQMAVRAISKACEAYKRDKKIKPVFRELGAVAFDQRILSWKGRDRVSILTLGGRIIVPVVYQGRWLATTGTTMRAQADLIYRDGKFYLAVVIDVPEPPNGPEPAEWLGVDLGIVNLATDSDGTAYTGKAVRAVRYRNRQLRARLQSKGTKSARRLLAKRRRRESRFARDVNHVISKNIVREAKGTGRGIKLEDLSGIRARTTVRKAQRADRDSWGFYQLRQFVTYKAAIVGVPVVLVDPRNTSRECAECGHIDKANRPSRDRFACKRCGVVAPADFNAARNIAGRAAVSLPDAA